MIEALEKLKELGFTVLEAQWRGCSQTADASGDWYKITLWVHQDDWPDAKIKLRTRLGVAMVQIGEDEQPIEKPRKSWDELTPSQQAGIRCNDPAFHSWIMNQPWAPKRTWCQDDTMADISATIVREACRVSSRSQIDGNLEAEEQWAWIDAAFVEFTRLPERH